MTSEYEEVKENAFMREKRLTAEELEKKWTDAKKLKEQLEDDVMGLNEEKKKKEKEEKKRKEEEEKLRKKQELE